MRCSFCWSRIIFPASNAPSRWEWSIVHPSRDREGRELSRHRFELDLVRCSQSEHPSAGFSSAKRSRLPERDAPKCQVCALPRPRHRQQSYGPVEQIGAPGCQQFAMLPQNCLSFRHRVITCMNQNCISGHGFHWHAGLSKPVKDSHPVNVVLRELPLTAGVTGDWWNNTNFLIIPYRVGAQAACFGCFFDLHSSGPDC